MGLALAMSAGSARSAPWRRRRRRRRKRRNGPPMLPAAATAAALVVVAAAVLGAAADAATSSPSSPSSSSIVGNWAVNSIGLSALGGGPASLHQLAAAADNIAAAFAAAPTEGGGDSAGGDGLAGLAVGDPAGVRFTPQGVVSMRLEAEGVPPAVIDVMLRGTSGSGGGGGGGGNATGGAASAVDGGGGASAHASALAAYAAMAVSSALPQGSPGPQVYVGREPMPESLLSWRLSDGLADESPDPTAWPPAPAFGGAGSRWWPGVDAAPAPAPAAPEPSGDAQQQQQEASRRPKKEAGGGRRALRQQQQQQKQRQREEEEEEAEKHAGPASAQKQPPQQPPPQPSVPLYISYYGLSPQQADSIAAFLNRTCPRPAGAKNSTTTGSAPSTKACDTALATAAAVLRPRAAELEAAGEPPSAAAAAAWAAGPRLFLGDAPVVQTFLTTAVPLTTAQVEGGAATDTDLFFDDAETLQAEVAPPGTVASTVRPQQFFGSYVPPRAKKQQQGQQGQQGQGGAGDGAGGGGRPALDAWWKVMLVIFAVVGAVAVAALLSYLAYRACRRSKGQEEAAGGAKAGEQQQQQLQPAETLNGSTSGGGGGAGRAGGGRRKRRAGVYVQDKGKGRGAHRSGGGGSSRGSGGPGPSSSSGGAGAGPSHSPFSGGSFAIVGAVFRPFSSSGGSRAPPRYPPHSQRGDSVSSAVRHELDAAERQGPARLSSAASAASLGGGALAPAGTRLPSTLEEPLPPPPPGYTRGGLFSPFLQQQDAEPFGPPSWANVPAPPAEEGAEPKK